jgi:outer membrane protein OmpA-like peptidoglycan-associated protein
MRILTHSLILLSAYSLAACSSTPDRYAFWRDDAPAVTKNTKPNLADVPAAPNIDQARQDMQDLQKKLAADRQEAYQQAQQDQSGVISSMTTVSSDQVFATTQNIQESNLPAVSQTGIQNMAAPGSDSVAPAIANPNRSTNLQNIYPVYTAPSVHINPPSNPLPQAGTIENYVYGRSHLQYHQAQRAPHLNAPALTPPAALNNVSDSITVDLSALGGSTRGTKQNALRPPMGALAASGSPTIYFNHGSVRLSPADKRTLGSIASLAQQGRTVKVIGHASQRAETASVAAAKAANLQISAKRAAIVMQELARKGVSAQQIEPIAVGDTQAATASSETKARRVDIVVE